jgi:hypothetical protein
MTFPMLAAGAAGAAAAAWLFARVTRQYALAAIAGGALILWMHGWLYFEYTADDAYITYRYARNLSEGAGPVWNPGERVEGYTNFLWMALLAAFDRIGAEPVRAGRWLGFALAAGAIGGTYALTRALLAGAAGRTAGLAAALALAAAGPFALWAFAGLETSLFATLVLAAVLLHIREDGRGGVPLSGVAWGFAALTRPDALLLFGVSAAARTMRAAWRVRDDGAATAWPEMARFGVWVAGFAAVFVPYFAWRYLYYDHLLPNTYYAKVGSGIDQYERGLYHLGVFSREYGAWLLLAVPAAIAFTRVRRGPAAYVLLLVLAWFAYVTYIGGDSLVRFRFFAPVLPLAYALVAASIAGIVESVGLERAPPRIVRDAIGAVAVAGFMLFTLQASAADFAVPPDREAVGERAEIGRWMRAHLPPETLIALIPAGAIPYESRLPSIDMLGINDVHIAHRDLDLGAFGAGHEKYDSVYVLDRQPDIIILMDSLDERPWRREDYGALSSGIIPARIDMLAQPRLWEAYEARTVRLREDAWLNLLVRRGASAVRAATQAP